MNELMYDQSSVLIASVLFASMVIAVELGYRIGRSAQASATESSRAQINAVQASLLGVLALLLGFTFSLSLQRFDSRSEAVVDEANAIGTAYLRTHLLTPAVRSQAQELLRHYVELRVQASGVALSSESERDALLANTGDVLAALWRNARQAVIEDPSPVTSGLYVQSLNELIDSLGRRDAALSRHVPEVVLFLLFGTFLMAGSVVGYASGVGGHRAAFVTYIMIALIVLLVFIIIDLDRPRRGLIEVSQKSLIELRRSVLAEQPDDDRSKAPELR